MKKGLIFKSLSAILLSVFIVTILASCNIFSKNQERIDKTVFYSVKHDGLQEDILRHDVVRSYNQRVQLYLAYGIKFDANEMYNTVVENLIKSKIVLIKAKKALYGDKVKNGTNMYQVLANNEKDYVTRQINKDLEDALESEVNKMKVEKKEALKEANKNNIEMAKRPRDPRAKLELNENKIELSKLNIDKDSITKAYFKNVDLFNEFVKEKLAKDGKNDAEKEILTKIYLDAYRVLMKNLEKSYKNYEDLEHSYAESLVLQNYHNNVVETNKKVLKADECFKDASEELKSLLSKESTNTYNSDLEAGKLVAFYKGKIERKDGKLLGNTSVAVRSILLQFNEEQKIALEQVKTKYGIDSNAYKQAREFFALQTEVSDEQLKNDELFNAVKEKTIKIYKSNSKYNKELPDSIDNAPFDGTVVKGKYEYKVYSVNEILNAIASDLKKATSDAIAKSSKESLDEAATAKTIADFRKNAFEKWINYVNDDPGMFPNEQQQASSSKPYLVELSGKTKYVPEYTALARALYENPNTIGVAQTLANVNTYSIDGKNIKINTVGEELSYIVNDFGVQFIMLYNMGPDLNSIDYIAYDKEGKEMNLSTANDEDLQKFSYLIYKAGAKLPSVVESANYESYTVLNKAGKEANKANLAIQSNVYNEIKDKDDMLYKNNKVINAFLKEINKASTK